MVNPLNPQQMPTDSMVPVGVTGNLVLWTSQSSSYFPTRMGGSVPEQDGVRLPVEYNLLTIDYTSQQPTPSANKAGKWLR